MGFIHIDCLREWMNNKRNKRVGEHIATYCWKNLDCELCHTKFPNVLEIQVKNKLGATVAKKINLIDL
jgi:E3 ubiquitin-protein ligase DOA10